jgi:uncharacterized protein
VSLVAAFPLGTAYLPGEAVILRVFEPRYLALLRDVEETTREFVTVLIEAGSEVGGGEKRFDVGVTVAIDHVAPAEFGFQLFAHAETVVDIVRWDDGLEYPRAEVISQRLHTGPSDDARAALRDVADDIRDFVIRVKDLGLAARDFSHLESTLEIPDDVASADDLWSTFWQFACLVPTTPMDKYEFLKNGDLPSRAARVRESLAHMNDLLTFRYG